MRSSEGCERDTNAESSYKATVTYNWDDMKNWMGIENAKTGYETAEVKNIDASRIVDVLAGGFGQSAVSVTILFLMDDGSVEYIPMKAVLTAGEVCSCGKLEGVKL